MNLNNLSVGKKLWGTVLGLMALMAILTVLLQTYTARVTAQAMATVQFNEDRISNALRWKTVIALTGEEMTSSSVTTDEELAADLTAKSKLGVAESAKYNKWLIDNLHTPEEKSAFERVVATRTEVLKVTADWQKARAGSDAQAARSLAKEKLAPELVKYNGAVDGFIDFLQKQRDLAKAQSDAQLATARWTGLGIIALLILLAIVLSALVVRSITAPLSQAVGLADTIASGDLTQDVQTDRKDELGRLLTAQSTMATRLRTLVGEVRQGVDTVSVASGEIASGNHDLSMRTEEAASSLQQTSASMEQITATVSQSVDTAKQANQLASQSAQAATHGSEVMAQVVTSMQHITESSKKINDIIGVIDGIAFQTNILALNAAVEAARAGEQGRGFAVVASEVRALAGRSAEAAKEIKGLISASVQSVQAGSTQVGEAGKAMEDIVSGVRRVSDLIGEITASAGEQRDGIAQVNTAVSQLDQMTQQNAALVEESAAAASSLSEQASRLEQAVSVFKVGGQAHAAPTPRAAAPRPASPISTSKPAPKAVRATAPSKIAPAKLPPAQPVKAKPADSEGDWESF